MVLFNDFSPMPILNIAGILKFFFLHFVGKAVLGGSFLYNTPLTAIGKGFPGFSPGLTRMGQFKRIDFC
jgi:hypothetical protein